MAESDTSRLHDLDDVALVVVTGVTNPLLGQDGAATVFGPQTGATQLRYATWSAASSTSRASSAAPDRRGTRATINT